MYLNKTPVVSPQKNGQRRSAEVLKITPEEDRLLCKYLSIPGLQSEDETFTKTVRFDDGMEMDIKCCGAQDDVSWTEAVLFDSNGCEVCCSEPDEEFVGTWELEHDGAFYKTVVRIAQEKGGGQCSQTEKQ